MTYGYNTELVGSNIGGDRLLEHRRTLIEQIDAARCSEEVIIFLYRSHTLLMVLGKLSEDPYKSLGTRQVIFEKVIQLANFDRNGSVRLSLLDTVLEAYLYCK
jgi:hypothetical protein